mmetsp:Transcript_8378/g.14592  ORF Transcript_8378/g.14592 Transcript_8378/m.14592 type:complete len:114 (+) Transcript_8378:77-418(+)
MDYNNDHLTYPNLVSAHIKTSNVLSPSSSSKKSSSSSSSLPPPPPPSSVILNQIEDYSSAYKKPSLTPYKFDVEREVMARAKKRREEQKKNGGEGGGGHNESIELTLSDVVDE